MNGNLYYTGSIDNHLYLMNNSQQLDVDLHPSKHCFQCQDLYKIITRKLNRFSTLFNYSLSKQIYRRIVHSTVIYVATSLGSATFALLNLDHVGTNPGLLALWEDERKRLRAKDLEDEVPLEAPSSPGMGIVGMLLVNSQWNFKMMEHFLIFHTHIYNTCNSLYMYCSIICTEYVVVKLGLKCYIGAFSNNLAW